MRLYTGIPFETFAVQRRSALAGEINSQADNYILNVNVDDYTAHLVQRFSVDIPEIHFDKVSADTIERAIPASRFPPEFMILDTDKTFNQQVIIYHLPYTGDITLLQLTPSPRALMHYDANFDQSSKCLLIEVIDFHNDPQRIKQRYDEEVRQLMSNYGRVRSNLQSFNDSLENVVAALIEQRRQQVLKKNNLLASLGVPIRKKDGVAETFSVPRPVLKEKIHVKPVVYEKDFKPEPTLGEDDYRKILKMINDVGKNYERLPATYKGKSEEAIRDHILLILDPNFEMGSAGGETFNNTGKTDISLRYDSSVVFIAECKYWKGEKSFLKTIDQLLGYLTWRNSKAAIINFVQNAEFTDVLNKVKSSIQTHPNYLKELRANDDTWFNYKFHLPGDRNRELDLAVISFHLPK